MERVIVHGGGRRSDDDGYPSPTTQDRVLFAKSVQPLSLEELSGQGRDGTVDILRVWASRGQPLVQPDDEVTVRGLRYVVEKTAWDWSVNRRPVNPRHRPSQVFDCVRGVA